MKFSFIEVKVNKKKLAVFLAKAQNVVYVLPGLVRKGAEKVCSGFNELVKEGQKVQARRAEKEPEAKVTSENGRVRCQNCDHSGVALWRDGAQFFLCAGCYAQWEEEQKQD